MITWIKIWSFIFSGEIQGICNCSRAGTFGRRCEYRLQKKRSFEEEIVHQFSLKEHHEIGGQLYGNRTCYTTLRTCDWGATCLDWRDICDGRFFPFPSSHLIALKKKERNIVQPQRINSITFFLIFLFASVEKWNHPLPKCSFRERCVIEAQNPLRLHSRDIWRNRKIVSFRRRPSLSC